MLRKMKPRGKIMMETRQRMLLMQIVCTLKEAQRTREGVPDHPELPHPKWRAERKLHRQLCSEYVC